MRTLQGKGVVRAPPLPDRQPVPCTGCHETGHHLPGQFPLGLHRVVRMAGCPGRAAACRRQRQPAGLDPERPEYRGYRGVRVQTIRGNSRPGRLAGSLQEIAISSVPVDVDVSFERPVAFSPDFDGTIAPVGFSGPVKSLSITGSAKVARVVDRITADTDLVATDAAVALDRGGIDVYQIAKLMTAGLLGKRRRFVPTRWAITAVDDSLSESLKKEIARFPPLEEILVFAGELYGNRIMVILVPGDWRYEMIEVWGLHSLWSGNEEMIVQDREGMKKSGYSRITGAYYSARLAVCEYLRNARRCARVIVVRNISGEYWAPLGTWVIREAARKAMGSPPVRCPSLADAVAEAVMRAGSGTWVPHSTLIPELASQRTLFQFAEPRQG